MRCNRWCTAVSLLVSLAAAAQDKPPLLPSDTPEKFNKVTTSFDYDKREEMIPMRDGVKLKTFILVPKGARDAPMLLSRTPYNAGERVEHFSSRNSGEAQPR